MQQTLTGEIGTCLDEAMDLTARYLSDRADLSASAAYVLHRVLRDGPTRLTTLAAKEGVGQPSMTQLIQRLERQDLVTRLADPEDGRAALVAITDTGRALIARRTELRRHRLDRLLEADAAVFFVRRKKLDEHNLTVLRRFLDRKSVV